MGWISYTSDGGTAGLAAFKNAYPQAVVEVSNTDNGIVAAVYEVGTKVCKIYATQHVVVTEYRGLTHDTALSLKAGVAGSSKTAFRTTSGTSWAVVPMLVGTERTAAVSRTNDAGGYKLTVTETTIAAGDVTASWVDGTSA